MIAALYGRDHVELDQIADSTVDDATAIALSRGRFPKGYEHMDPNEDAVLAARLPGGRLLVVADGHNGVEAAHAAVAAIADAAPAILGAEVSDPDAAVDDLFDAARRNVGRVLEDVAEARAHSRTALSVALLTKGAVHTATCGDTAVLVVRGGKGKVVSGTGPFLGPRSALPDVTRTKLRGGEAVVAVSDGVVDYLGLRWVRTAGACVTEAETAHEAAVALVRAAMAGGAGDNIAVALADV